MMSALIIVCGSFSCSPSHVGEHELNIIPRPKEAAFVGNSEFQLLDGMGIYMRPDTTSYDKVLTDYLKEKIGAPTGFSLERVMIPEEAQIVFSVDEKEGGEAGNYTLDVTEDQITVRSSGWDGAFYAVQSLLQLFPSEIESPVKVKGPHWSIPCVHIEDGPRFVYRGLMLDVCRHFLTVDQVKKHIDMMSMFKLNILHLHFTEDQAWRFEVKKYPQLTEVGGKRIEGEGFEYSGYYTQEDLKEIVNYASARRITVVPEFELPGHELAAIAALPELSCNNTVTSPRIVWGVEDIVICPGKESTFEFIENVLSEMVQIFPGKYFHIGGDECPKKSWATCPLCQKRIREEKLFGNSEHTAEEMLQSYVIRRVEKILEKYDKKLIGWDEILEGGLSENATVMSWRGELGGISAAMNDHDVIMTPNSEGLYLNHYQGDSFIEPVTNGGYALLKKTYSYDPISEKILEIGKKNRILGVQGNLWSEYLYTPEKFEYMLYPRLLAVAEVGWTSPEKKDFMYFCQRVDKACERLDEHGIHYHIPLPEQPGGSSDLVAFVDTVHAEFKTTRPMKMVYTLDGKEPDLHSKEYVHPISITESTILKIATVLPSGKMSKVRTVKYEQQVYSASHEVDKLQRGLLMKKYVGLYSNAAELQSVVSTSSPISSVMYSWNQLAGPRRVESMRNQGQFAVIAEGYLDIPENGIYMFRTDNDEFWIDGKLLIDNAGEVKRHCRNNPSVALSKGIHPIKVIYISNIIGGWPNNWSNCSVMMKKYGDEEKIDPIKPVLLYHN